MACPADVDGLPTKLDLCVRVVWTFHNVRYIADIECHTDLTGKAPPRGPTNIIMADYCQQGPSHQ